MAIRMCNYVNVSGRLLVPNQFRFIPSPSSIICRFVSTVSITDQFTVEYLINSCGLSPESALKTSKQVALKSPTAGPDSILSLFQTYGFTQSHISTLITKRPNLLFANPEKTIKPKLEFFTTIGISGSHLGKLVSSYSHILQTSLEKQIIPSVAFLRSLVLTDSHISLILNRSRWSLHNIKCTMEPNIAILRDLGIPESNISKLIVKFPQSLCYKFNRFNKVVVQLEEMGFNPSTMTFMRGLHVLSMMRKPTWDAKVALYQSFGLSYDEVIYVFRKQPMTMAISGKNIHSALDFFINSLKWSPRDVIYNPIVITFSLENRVIPRCHVCQILLSNGLMSNVLGIRRALMVSEDIFLKNYVIKHRYDLPDLLKTYQNGRHAQCLYIGSKDKTMVAKL